MEFKDRLKKARNEKGLSQSELADLVDIHVTNISRYERGAHQPATEVLIKLADALDVSADYLMNGSVEDMANGAISDKQLLRQFKKVEQLSNEKKKLVKEFLDAFLFKQDVKQKMA